MAIHAGAWRHPDEFKLIGFAERRIPLKIIVGDRDEFFPLRAVRATQDALKRAGFPIEVEIVPRQHHRYNESTAPGINESAWTFLRDKTLGEAPVFTDYVP
jgi:dienelactone hydrolase